MNRLSGTFLEITPRGSIPAPAHVEPLRAGKYLLIAFGLMLALPTAFHGQEDCPVAVLAANPNAVSAVSGSALSLTFHNTSSAQVTANDAQICHLQTKYPSSLTPEDLDGYDSLYLLMSTKGPEERKLTSAAFFS
jgi:hypothetical protein